MSKIADLIVDLIARSKAPLDFGVIESHLIQNNLSPNKTTIYRNLEKLETEGLLKKVILSDQKQFWEKIHSLSRYHFHLICTICDKIECRESISFFNFDLGQFQIQKTELNFFGKCQNCLSK
jgi:Fe2+ or Zn2+ uptake regulation protein